MNLTGIEYRRPEYDKYESRWSLIRKVIDIDKPETFLRTLETALPETNQHRKERNKQYGESAMFYPLLQQPMVRIGAAAFRKLPETKLPSKLSYLEGDVDGSGVSLHQQAQRAFTDTLAVSRAGLYVGAPPEGGDPRIYFIEAEQIINWRVDAVDGERVLSLVVIESVDYRPKNDNPYELEQVTEYLELRLVDGVAYAARHVKGADDLVEEGELMPLTDSRSGALNRLPFLFIGELNNDERIDVPSMYPLARLNVGHYRNSADFEEAAMFAGNPVFYTPDGINEADLDMMKKQGMNVASSSIMPVNMGVAQAGESTMSRTAMMDKADAIANFLGQLIGHENTGNKTAAQVETENSASDNVLMQIARNVSKAYVDALNICAELLGVTGEIEFKIHSDFIKPAANPQILATMVQGFLQGSVPAYQLYWYNKTHGILPDDMTFDEFSDQTSVAGVINGSNTATN